MGRQKGLQLLLGVGWEIKHQIHFFFSISLVHLIIIIFIFTFSLTKPSLPHNNFSIRISNPKPQLRFLHYYSHHLLLLLHYPYFHLLLLWIMITLPHFLSLDLFLLLFWFLSLSLSLSLVPFSVPYFMPDQIIIIVLHWGVGTINVP